jgi:peptide/nickel transport system substrate-binding protein
VDAAAAEAMGEAFTTKAVLTGPFKVEKFLKDEELVVVRHDDYWGPAPLVDRVIFLALADQNSRVLALQSGDIDIAAYIAPESVATVQSSSNLKVRPSAPVALDFLYLNHQKESWSDANVRQAIAIAIDREALVEAIMLGQGAPAIGPFPPQVLGCDGLRAHNFDPAKAKQLLAEAGYRPKEGNGYLEKDGQTLTMRLVTYPQRSELIPMAEAIQAMLKDIGVKVDVRVSEQINAELEQGDWDGGMYFGGMATTGDPYRSLSRFFITGSERNFGGYSSPQVDELTRQVGESTDRQEREQLACAASQVITDDVALIPLVYPNINYGVSNQIMGFDEPHPFSLYFMDSKIGKR